MRPYDYTTDVSTKTCRTSEDILASDYLHRSNMASTKGRIVADLMMNHVLFDISDINKNKKYIRNVDGASYRCQAEVKDNVVTCKCKGVLAVPSPTIDGEPEQPVLKGEWWLVDSGCGHDLLASKKSKDLPITDMSHDTTTFCTANGITNSESVATSFVPEISQTVSSNLLESTPSALPIGRRCVE